MQSTTSLVSQSPSAQADVRRVLWLTLGLNLLVAGGKVLVGLWSGALAILADGLHSISDAGGNIAGLMALEVANRPPDAEHPYGHRRFETLAALSIGVLLLLSGWEVMQGVLERVWQGNTSTTPSALAVGVLVVTLLINIGVSRYQKHVGRQHQSQILLADAENTSADVYVTLSVLGSNLLTWAGFGWADTLVALGVALLILRAAWRVLSQAGGVLVDTAPYPEGQLKTCAANVRGVRRVIRARSRGTANAAHIDIDVQVAESLTVGQINAIGEQIRANIYAEVRAVGGDVCEIEVHFEPLLPREHMASLQ